MATVLLGPSFLTAVPYGSSGASTGYIGGLAFSSSNALGGPTGESWSGSGNISSLYRAATQYTLVYNSTVAPTINKFLVGGPAGSTRLNIYMGGRPSISAMTNLNDYASQLLVSFSIPAYTSSRATSGYFIDPSSAFTGGTSAVVSPTIDYSGCTLYLGMCPTFTAAAASGTATWFWFGNYSSPTNLGGISFVTGNIGLTGSGSDLEMADTNITAGALYKSLGFKFFIPAVQSTI